MGGGGESGEGSGGHPHEGGADGSQGRPMFGKNGELVGFERSDDEDEGEEGEEGEEGYSDEGEEDEEGGLGEGSSEDSVGDDDQ